MGALSKLQLSLFCFVGSLCLQVVTLNLEEAFFVLHKSPRFICLSENKFETQIKKKKKKKILVSACELIRCTCTSGCLLFLHKYVVASHLKHK